MKTAKYSVELRDFLAARGAGLTVGFVPTMGALHRGHLSLAEAARRECDVVVASIFVNPTQFNDPADLASYPRMPEQDMKLLEGAGVDVAFVPSVEEIYPKPDTRQFDFGPLARVMEGASRPGHFNGVAQVVSRLFDIVQPDRAYFGEKDFQQVAVVRAMVGQLGYKVEIVSCPTVREADGLAMSSRNLLLDKAHRAAAPYIYMALQKGVELGRSLSPAEVRSHVVQAIDATGLLRTIYFNIVDTLTLQEVERWDDHRAIRGCVAVQAGAVRLIDNIAFRS
ncbi:MAG: pantoate--beta-alanine ligase [Rikenellaceae bacterium]|jgi:pantoate--beta-alanine ligase|nr:pantoate--beta-alanine ligase [Rikenellaceae bacterium]